MSSTHLTSRPIAVVDSEDGDFVVEGQDGEASYQPYAYKPLQTRYGFRLLELLPGAFLDKLCCKIAEYRIDAFNVPLYTALSYTWGDSQFDRLVINGRRVPMESDLRSRFAVRHPLYCCSSAQQVETRLLISTNLRDALRRLRHRRLPVLFWIDAVCINQLDDEERTAQIMLMQRIYHRSNTVRIWLGEADEDTAPAFEMIGTLSVKMGLASLSPDDPSYESLPEPEDFHDQFLESRGLPLLESGKYGAFMRLLDRPVFRRIWCVQEAVVASSNGAVLHCGPWYIVPVGIQDHRAPKPVLQDMVGTACSFLRKSGWHLALQRMYVNGRDCLWHPTTVSAIRSDWFNHRAHLDRSLILYEMRPFLSTDPRDKIFALLGLLTSEAAHGQDRSGGAQSYARPLNADEDCIDNQHAWDCVHHRRIIHHAAQEKYRRNYGIEALWYAASTRIYGLRYMLDQFFRAALHFVEATREVLRTGSVNTEDDRWHLVEDISELQKAVDEKFHRIRNFLNNMCGKHVSSDELVAFAWASNVTQDCMGACDVVSAYPESTSLEGLEKLGLDQRLAHLEKLVIHLDDFMNRKGDGYASSSPAHSSIADSIEGSDDERSELILERPAPESLRTPNWGTREDSPEEEEEEEEEDVYEKDSWMIYHADEIPPELILLRFTNTPTAIEPAAKHDDSHHSFSPVTVAPTYSLTAAEVYRDFTVECMHLDNKLDLLSAIVPPISGGVEGLPSWVPDFSVSLTERISPLVMPQQHGNQSWLYAWPNTSMAMQWDPTDPSVLRLDGCLVDRIAKSAPMERRAMTFLELHHVWLEMIGEEPAASSSHSSTAKNANAASVELEYVHQLREMLNLPLDFVPATPPKANTAWGNLIFGLVGIYSRPSMTVPENALERAWECYAVFLAILYIQQLGADMATDVPSLLSASGIPLGPWMRQHSDGEEAEGLIRMIRMLAIGRKMVYTEKGHLVFALETAAAGDIICLLKGGKVPFILREKKSSEYSSEPPAEKSRYQLVGECFSYWMMRGEMAPKDMTGCTTIALE